VQRWNVVHDKNIKGMVDMVKEADEEIVKLASLRKVKIETPKADPEPVVPQRQINIDLDA